jgi:hypothetical protein
MREEGKRILMPLSRTPTGTTRLLKISCSSWALSPLFFVFLNLTQETFNDYFFSSTSLQSPLSAEQAFPF